MFSTSKINRERKKKKGIGKHQGWNFLSIWNKSVMLRGRDTHELMTHVSSAEGSSTTLWCVTDFCLYEHRHHKAFCMIQARLFILQISDGDLSEMLLLFWILTRSHLTGEKKNKVWIILSLSEWSNQYFEPCLNHLLFETLDIFSCVAVKCFFLLYNRHNSSSNIFGSFLFSLLLFMYLPLDVCVVDKFSAILVKCHPN